MLIAADIGNTNIAVGVFGEKRLIRHWKIKTERDKTCDEYAVILLTLLDYAGMEREKITRAIISSVVPPLTPIFQKVCRELFEVRPLTVGPGLKTGMPILYETPQEVGADRIVASVAAFTRFGGPCIVLDFGTATTFDVVSASGEYLGGAIAPGIQIAAEALFRKTAQLPHIEIKKPEKAIGRTTVTSMQSGLFHGYVGLVSRIIDSIKNEIPQPDTVKVIATGGLASLFIPELSGIDHDTPHLVLEGLRILAEKNSPSSREGI